MRVRSDILRTYQSIHTWTGIITGLVLFIGFYAGSLSMFEEEINYWATPPSNQLQPIALEKYDLMIAKALATHENAQTGFTLNFQQHLSPMTWFERGGGKGLTLNDIERHATLDANDELVSHAGPTNELGSLIDMLHRTAGIAGKVGHERLGVIVLGIASVLYFLALVSGVIFLLPTLAKSFFALRTHKGANRFWLDSHNLVGIVSLPFHLIIAWTVVVFAFHDIMYDGLKLVYADKPLFERAAKTQQNYTIEDLPSIKAFQEEVSKVTEGYQIKKISFTGLNSPRPLAGITIVNGNEMMRNNTGDFIYMHPYDMTIEFASIPTNDEEYYVSIVASFFSLHFGGYGGELGKWLYFVMGLLGAFLFYSGNLIWLEKRRKKQGNQTRSTRIMASLTIGVCLGSMLAVAITILSSKWFYLITDEVNYYYLGCYYLVFFASLIYSFTSGAARSAIHLLRLLAVSCLLIPLTTIVALLFPQIGVWPAANLSGYGVDIIALLFAIGFYFAAKKTKERAYYGEDNSLWSLKNEPSHSFNKEPLSLRTHESR